MARKKNGSVRIEILAREDCPNRGMALVVVERVVDWVRPDASPIGFPRLRVGDTRAFCERLALEAGVLLLPGDVYDEPGHVRFGLGRVGAAEAFGRLSAFLAAA